MPRTTARLCFLALLLVAVKASLAAADQAFQVPFEYGSGRTAILLHVRINDKPALLILDTGSAHTILQPEFLGINPAELAPTRFGSSGGGFVGDAIGREITLQVGIRKWSKWRVAIMDLGQVLSAYSEKPDGILGLDFLQQFSQVTINIRDKTITFVGTGSDKFVSQLRVP